jgi:hypothetical protein
MEQITIFVLGQAFIDLGIEILVKNKIPALFFT